MTEDEQRVPLGTRAFVLTVSDGVAGGSRQDETGVAVGARLEHLGFTVERGVFADERTAIEDALRTAIWGHALVITNGGTGLTPRDVTPQATAAVLDYEVPGLAEAMRAAGRAKTPMADLSRGVVGVSGRTLVINVPGSPRAALESLEALEPTLRHALETLAGPFDHGIAAASGRPDLPEPSLGGAAPVPPPGALGGLSPDSSPVGSSPFGTSAASFGTEHLDVSTPGVGVAPPVPGDKSDPWRDLPEPRPGAVSDDELR